MMATRAIRLIAAGAALFALTATSPALAKAPMSAPQPTAVKDRRNAIRLSVFTGLDILGSVDKSPMYDLEDFDALGPMLGVRVAWQWAWFRWSAELLYGALLDTNDNVDLTVHHLQVSTLGNAVWGPSSWPVSFRLGVGVGFGNFHGTAWSTQPPSGFQRQFKIKSIFHADSLYAVGRLGCDWHIGERWDLGVETTVSFMIEQEATFNVGFVLTRLFQR